MAAFFDEKNLRDELALWRSLKRLEKVFVRGVRIILFIMERKKALSWTRRRNFSTSCLTENSLSFLDIGTKLNPLLRTDFSASESGRFSGIVTTVLGLSSDESQVIGRRVNCSNFWALIWCKWLKSLELTSWILVRIECQEIVSYLFPFPPISKSSAFRLAILIFAKTRHQPIA